MKPFFRRSLPYLLLGGIAGFINGFLGTGGGILLLFGSFFLSRGRKTDMRDLLASTALVTLILSAISAVVYFLKGSVGTASLPSYLIPALLGGALGALLLDRLPIRFLEKLFAVLVIVAGGLMLFR
jgi:uncharacterized membrane protein YfcA